MRPLPSSSKRRGSDSSSMHKQESSESQVYGGEDGWSLSIRSQDMLQPRRSSIHGERASYPSGLFSRLKTRENISVATRYREELTDSGTAAPRKRSCACRRHSAALALALCGLLCVPSQGTSAFMQASTGSSWPIEDMAMTSAVFRASSRSPLGLARAALQREGKVEFVSGDCFYRPHSKVIRDLGVLALRVQGQRRMQGGEAGLHVGGISVLDAMCGSGVRALRYLEEGGATFVLANDANDDLEPERIANLAGHIAAGRTSLTMGDALDAYFAAKLDRRYFDLVDADGFGSGTPHSAEAWLALRVGGLLYLCSTDARTAAGKNSPATAWRGFGAVAQGMPASNELGVRLLVADAVRQASARGLEVSPVFGLYHRKSSCSRVMMRLNAAGKAASRRTKQLDSDVAMAAYCQASGEHWAVPLDSAHDPRGAPTCPPAARHGALAEAGWGPGEAAAELRVTGPVWVGGLQDEVFVGNMLAEAEGNDDMREAAKVLAVMASEAREGLPPMYFRLKEIGRLLAEREGISDLPRKVDLVAELRRRGFTAGESQAEAQAIKTSAHMADVLSAAKALVVDASPAADAARRH